MDKSGGYLAFPFVAEFYDDTVPYKERQDVQFFVESSKTSGGKTLELGSGTGRVLIPTAQAGCEIVGLDLSPRMMDKCRTVLAEEPDEVQARVSLVEGDMCNFDLDEQFSLVTMPFRPFQHIETVDEQIQCLQTVHRHLEPGGKLILDLFNPSLKFLVDDKALIESGDEPEFTMADGRKVLRRMRVAKRDHFSQVSDVEIIYYVTHPSGKKERLVHEFRMHYLFRWEAEHLLVRCGFEVDHLYAGYDKSAFGSKDPGELIFVARKV
ncbi:MAG: class I SAM-dependent methyltransferase [candidate division Zixibacteria bacterium]|nr:class I SAM-dependent methyltransferase [candidate division Zixibacteria bacterium]MDH3939012.1 class I SAM-dependent methyltransferase [candidate division Zixibacteria bacterium]MDH4033417.1 class I SAM-dependent methyltransferase [candidate division Zixibacteria bacterium]